jgi:outer membrane lipoprotein-sorting protein
LVLVACVACGGRQVRPDDFSSDPAPFVELLDARDKAIKSLTGEFDVELWRAGERVRFKQLIAVDGSGRLRIDALSPMGSPISVLVSDGGRLMIYAISEKRFYIGEASPENLGRLLPVAMEPSELSSLLRGAIPRMAYDKISLEWDSNEGAYSLMTEAKSRREQVDFEPKSRDVSRVRRWEGDALVYEVLFATYQGDGATRIPQRIRLKVPTKTLEVDLKVVSHRVNPDLPIETFQLKPPRGVIVQAL